MPTGPQRQNYTDRELRVIGTYAVRPKLYVRPHSQQHGWMSMDPWSSEPEPFSGPEFSSVRAWNSFAINPVLNGVQMRTFVDPEEYIPHVTDSVDRWDPENESMEDIWSYKEREARKPADYTHGSGVYDWMKAGEPQRNPAEAELYGSDITQGEGHHRVVGARAVQRDTGQRKLVKIKVHGYD